MPVSKYKSVKEIFWGRERCLVLSTSPSIWKMGYCTQKLWMTKWDWEVYSWIINIDDLIHPLWRDDSFSCDMNCENQQGRRGESCLISRFYCSFVCFIGQRDPKTTHFHLIWSLLSATCFVVWNKRKHSIDALKGQDVSKCFAVIPMTVRNRGQIGLSRVLQVIQLTNDPIPRAIALPDH